MNKNPVLYGLIGTLVLASATAITAYLVPHIPLVWQILGGLTLLVGLIAGFMGRKAWAQTLGRRTTIYGFNSFVMVILFLGIVVVLNRIVIRYDVKKDFTKSRLHSLSEQSIKFVKGLDQEIKLRAFITPMQRNEFQKIFEKYTYYSKKLVPEYIDVDQDPLQVQKYEIKRAGTIVVESAARSSKVEGLSGPDDPKVEQKITNALIQVAKGDKKKIYFVTGHGETLASDVTEQGLSQLKESLEGSRYEVKELPLIESETVPADAELLVVAGPKKDFLLHELKALEAYIQKGGKVLFMMEPDSSVALKSLLAKFGVEWGSKKAVLETNVLQRLAGGNPLMPIVNTYEGTHEITQDLKQLSIFAIASPVEKAPTLPKGVTATSLLSTSGKSFEVPLTGDKVNFNPDRDKKGPVSLAVAISGKIEEPKPEKAEKPEGKDEGEKKEEKDYRLVVVGDANFATNGLRNKGVNSDLLENMVSWLSHDSDLIAIRPKPTDSSTFEITESRFRVINLASVVIAPLFMFLSAFGVWFSRRRK